ncbi:MAG: aminotransferase class I/II-fold pyridoxal phosphate-dependent enzyme [Planctomycetota bacterium]|nr:MAG: aminotransferase class I/II-fold pyridoxal phosphate-dependent enzyme [Planctomycetota bacterium]
MQRDERISNKLRKFRPSLTLALKTLVQERRAQGLPVYDFGLGETKGKLDPDIRAAGEGAFRDEDTMYSDPAGLYELRAEVIRWLGLGDHYTPDHVVISTGAKQSLFNIFLALCDPSDCVLFDAAPWVSYQPLVTMAYAFPVMVLPLGQQRDGLKVTPVDLERNLDARPHARLFLINNPVNPTAQLYSEQEINALLNVCAERGVFFVLDRLYWRIVFDGQSYPEPEINEKTRPWLIQVDGLSKNFRRTGGLRIGWTVAPRDVAQAMVNLQSHYTANPSVPTQRAAFAAISRVYNNELPTDLQAKRDLLHECARHMPHVKIWPTPATFYSFWDVTDCLGMRTPEGVELRTSDDVAAYLVREAGVVTASGRAFMRDGYLRLSFAVDAAEIKAGMAAARAALEKLQAVPEMRLRRA